MKIAYVLYPEAVISGNSNGIKNQALSWKKALEKNKHQIVEVNVWDNYNWDEFDLIHIFGTGMWLYNLVSGIYKKNKNIVISPIIDSDQSYFNYKLSTFVGLKKLRLWSPTYALKKSLPFLKGVFVRSDYESGFFSKSMNFDNSKIFKIPVGFDLLNEGFENIEREKFCFHISSIYQERKNVIRLIKAAKKYNFKLVLAGSKGSQKQFMPIKDEIGGAKNIEVLGFVSEKEMLSLFTKAEVFALPSLIEGVGIVGLNAAANGCKIVITSIGGPKEYYNGMAELVNPYDVDNIGKSIIKLMNNGGCQPKLRHHILNNYNEDVIFKKLESVYFSLIS